MEKIDWCTLQAEFLKAHEETNITVQQWCKQKDLNHASARRHIRIVNIQRKIKHTKAKVIKRKAKTKAVVPEPRAYSTSSSHGGYSKYFNKDITTLVEGADLTDELDLCRARIHLVVCTIEEIQRRLDNKDEPVDTETASSLFSSLFKADTALDRNVARVESITKTLSSIRIDDLNEHKIRADTFRSMEITKATVINAKKSIVQTELTQLAVDKARKELGGTSKLDDYIDSKVGTSVDVVIG